MRCLGCGICSAKAPREALTIVEVVIHLETGLIGIECLGAGIEEIVGIREGYSLRIRGWVELNHSGRNRIEPVGWNDVPREQHPGPDTRRTLRCRFGIIDGNQGAVLQKSLTEVA